MKAISYLAATKILYTSYHHNDEWSAGQKLISTVNNGIYSGGPYVSPDGKMLYYSQEHAPRILMIPLIRMPANNSTINLFNCF
jgi:WD40-like Beta Propeller Repeat